MIYIQPLQTFTEKTASPKLNGIIRLLHIGIPTVSNGFLLPSSLFQDYIHKRKLPDEAIFEIEQICSSIKKLGYTITLRNAVYEQNNPALSFAVSNTLNISNIHEVLRLIERGYRRVKQQVIDPENVECHFLIQSYYLSIKCGSLISSDSENHISILGIIGQHTDQMLRKDCKPDKVIIEKRTYKILTFINEPKYWYWKKTQNGMQKIRIKKELQHIPVLSKKQAIYIAQLSQLVERKYGPQEMNWAILNDGSIIFQETHDIKQTKGGE